jgi:2-iminobutanoate/2-iminopropanoate deaminase
MNEEGRMPKQQIRTDEGAAPLGAYSQGIRAGDFVYVAGQGPIDPATGKITGETIEEQVQLTLQNVQAVLEAAGATTADVVKATVHLADIGDFQRFNAVYAEVFPDPKPARTTVQSVMPGILVEIDVVAYTGP